MLTSLALTVVSTELLEQCIDAPCAGGALSAYEAHSGQQQLDVCGGSLRRTLGDMQGGSAQLAQWLILGDFDR